MAQNVPTTGWTLRNRSSFFWKMRKEKRTLNYRGEEATEKPGGQVHPFKGLVPYVFLGTV